MTRAFIAKIAFIIIVAVTLPYSALASIPESCQESGTGMALVSAKDCAQALTVRKPFGRLRRLIRWLARSERKELQKKSDAYFRAWINYFQESEDLRVFMQMDGKTRYINDAFHPSTLDVYLKQLQKKEVREFYLGLILKRGGKETFPLIPETLRKYILVRKSIPLLKLVRDQDPNAEMRAYAGRLLNGPDVNETEVLPEAEKYINPQFDYYGLFDGEFMDNLWIYAAKSLYLTAQETEFLEKARELLSDKRFDRVWPAEFTARGIERILRAPSMVWMDFWFDNGGYARFPNSGYQQESVIMNAKASSEFWFSRFESKLQRLSLIESDYFKALPHELSEKWLERYAKKAIYLTLTDRANLESIAKMTELKEELRQRARAILDDPVGVWMEKWFPAEYVNAAPLFWLQYFKSRSQQLNDRELEVLNRLKSYWAPWVSEYASNVLEQRSQSAGIYR